MARIKLLTFLITLLSVTQISFAQKDSIKGPKDNVWWKKGKQYVLITNDGTEYTGEIIGDNEREILIMTPTMGKLYIPKYSIRSINMLDRDNFTNGEFIDPNNHRNFYMINTNVLPFKKREFRISHAYFAGFSGTYSINENVAVGLQTTIIGAPMGAVLKTSFQISPGSYVGTDFNIASLTYFESSSYVGNISAKYTRGDDKTNFTLMGGVGFASILQFSGGYGTPASSMRRNENQYYFNASVFHRLTKNAGFAGEGWLIPRENMGVIGLGIRTMKRKEVSWSFGFYNFIYQGYPNNGYVTPNTPKTTKFTPIPYFGATYTL